jgi:hypothetical protein
MGSKNGQMRFFKYFCSLGWIAQLAIYFLLFTAVILVAALIK